MAIRSCTALAGLVGALVLPLSVSAAPLYHTFGPLDEATFGGTGIPNQEVAISSQYSNGKSLITVAMGATQRYSNPALTNDGLGTYFAQAGSNDGLDGGAHSLGATWNFNYYLSIASIDEFDPTTETLADYQITLFYDFDRAEDNGPSGLGTLDLTVLYLYSPTNPLANPLEGSENLMFDYLTAGIPGYAVPPTLPDNTPRTFDPNATGEYNFGWGVENVRMDVQVTESVPDVHLPAAVQHCWDRYPWASRCLCQGAGWKVLRSSANRGASRDTLDRPGPAAN